MLDTRMEKIDEGDIHSYTPANSMLPGYDILSLCVQDKNVWCGIRGKGVACCSFSHDYSQITHCEQYTVTQGLASNNVNIIQLDQYNNICLGTESGPSVINGKSHNVRTFQFSQQIADNYFIPGASLMLPDGTLLFGTMGGLLEVKSTFNPSHSGWAERKLLFTDLHVNGRSVYDMAADQSLEPMREALSQGKSIVLGPDENNIAVYFSTMQMTDADATSYQFYLEGLEKTWNPMTNHPEATYSQLSPGNYTFHVKALVNGQWSDDHTLQFRVNPLWWQTWWAYLIYICIAATIGLYIYRLLRHIYRLRQHVKEERQRTEMERQLTDYKIRFFTNISHEFRTPLTISRGMMERLKQLNQQGNMKQPLDTMQHSTDRMLRLVNQLLEFRKMQQGKLSLQLREADIVAYVQNIYMDFHEAAEEKDIHFDFRTQMRSLRMPFDAGKIDKIVYNLISNAFKYTQRKGSISVALRQDVQTHVVIEVSDSGVGVPQELREHLFDRYMESSRVVKDSLGIGLTLTAELVRTHHGTITHNENEGGGSIFTVTLPTDRTAYKEEDFMADSALNNQEEETVPRGFEQAYREMQANPLNEDVTVLVVEDDGDVASYIAQTLAPYFKVVTASNGEEALSQLSTLNPQLIVSDVMMPQMDGYELTRRLRKDERWRHIPIILLTALTDQDKYLKGITSGADLYLPKPFSPSVLVAHALQLVNQRSRVRQQATAEKEKRQAEQPQVAVSDIRDKNFLKQVDDIISRHLSDEQLSVETLTDGLGIGRSKLFEKMKTLMDMTPRDYILQRRMERAVELLKEGQLSIAEIAYKTGFGHPPYFTRVFKKYYGVTPSDYIKARPQTE